MRAQKVDAAVKVERAISIAHNGLRLGDVAVFENRQPVTNAE